jgi:hypothetical protein
LEILGRTFGEDRIMKFGRKFKPFNIYRLEEESPSIEQSLSKTTAMGNGRPCMRKQDEGVEARKWGQIKEVEFGIEKNL